MDGSTLVIDTAHFASHKTGNGYTGVPSGPMKHLVERLALDEGGTTLSYSFELRDPEFLAAPCRAKFVGPTAPISRSCATNATWKPRAGSSKNDVDRMSVTSPDT